jgi:uncharacterized protein YkwD
MYTLQILDRGQTFLHPLDDRPLVVGSSPEAGLRLAEEEVMPQHARIEGTDGKLRIVAMAKLLVNGRATQAADLALGDRIEIGRAVLVVGQSVPRKASPEDVLAEPRRRLERAPARRAGKLVPLLAAGVLAGGIVAFVWSNGSGSSSVQAELAMLERTLDKGDLERATKSLDKLRREWIDASDDRLERLARVQHRLDGIREAEVQLTAEVLDPELERTKAQWMVELQRLEQEGDQAERVAARRVRSSLTETLLRRPAKRAVPAQDAEARSAAAGPATAGQSQPVVPVPPPANQKASTAPAETSADVAAAEARRFADSGLFAQAVAMLQAEAGQVKDPAVVARLQQQIADVRAAAVRAMETLVADGKKLCADGKPREAITAIATAQHRFPGTAEFAPLGAALREAEAAVVEAEQRQRRQAARPDAVVPQDDALRVATLATLRQQLDLVRTAEERAEFAEAARLLRQGAAMVADRDADFAGRLESRAIEADLLAAWHAAVAAHLGAGKAVDVQMRSGRTMALRSVDGAALLGATADGEVRVTWHDVAARGVQSLCEAIKVDGDAALGAATLLYKGGEAALAEAVLAKLLRADAGRKAVVDAAVARGRGEPADPRGYTLGKEGFVSARSIEIQKESQKLVVRLDAVLRGKDGAARKAFVDEVLAQGPDMLGAFIGACRKELTNQVAKLEAGTLKKQIDKLDAQRAELDRARQHAKDLIYDEVKYFYPYRPPAVTPDRFAEYNRVQAEVDRRVAAVRVLWHDDKQRVRIPASLQTDLDRLDWVAKVLADLGELDAAMSAQVDWARALPPGDSVGIVDFCRTPAERDELEQWRRIEAYNAVVAKQASSGARELLKITNGYRAMFRHRPLALVERICSAAQGHAEEMSKLSYFAHMSPTPGRRTPFERMRNAGYDFGVSENIALHDSAQGAHDAWCRSSGHHRNLLNPNHKEFGVGQDGRNWVENFGSGSTYEQHAAWPRDAVPGRLGQR